MNMVLKSLQPFLLHIYKILEMSLCLCMSRRANERKMVRERDEDREKLMSVLCTTGPAYSLGVISISNEKQSVLKSVWRT